MKMGQPTASGNSENLPEGRSVFEIWGTLNDDQIALVEYLVGQVVDMTPEERDIYREANGDLDVKLGEMEDFYGEDWEGKWEAEMEAGHQETLNKRRQELIDLINDLAVVRGKVTLSSGKEADYYIDLRRVTLHHKGAPLIGTLLTEHLENHGFTPELRYDKGGWYRGERKPNSYSAIGGLTLGADPIATAVMHHTSLLGRAVDSFVVRKAAKAHGMQKQIEGPDIAGRKVIIVEDTTTTGGSPIAAIEAVRAAGATPLAVATIVDRDTGAREKIEALGVPYLPLLNLADLTI